MRGVGALVARLVVLVVAAACTDSYDALTEGATGGGGPPASGPGGLGGHAGADSDDTSGAPASGAGASGVSSSAATGGAGGASVGSGGAASSSASTSGSGGGLSSPCGNGVVDADEECDDAGTANDDGCSADCVVECSGAKTAKHRPTKHCYRYIDDALVTWQAGRDACFALGTGWDLAIITSEDERDFVDDDLAPPEGTRFANDDPFQYWLGGRDLSQQNEFEWINGEPWGYAPWDPGDPSHGIQNCIRLRALQGSSDDTFRDAECALTSSVLCELQPAGTAP